MNLFFSYSRTQKEEVIDLVDFVSVYHDYWFDSKIGAGMEWWKEILSQIRNCDVFVFVLSNDSIQSKACRAELSYAELLGKHKVILQVDKIDPAFFPASLKADNVTPYNASDNTRKNKLLRSLKEIEENILPHWKPGNYNDIPEPAMPVSELSAILSEIEAEKLSLDSQEKLLNRIERLIAKKEEKAANIEKALELFIKRDDINYLVGKKIDAMLPLRKAPLPDAATKNVETNLVLRDVIEIVGKFSEDKIIGDRLKNQIHTPTNLYGTWRRIRSIQNGQNIPVMFQELVIFHTNYAFQLIRNNMQANYGSYMFNQEFLTIHFANGMIDTRSYQCFSTELYIVQYMNNVAFNVDCYQRSL